MLRFYTANKCPVIKKVHVQLITSPVSRQRIAALAREKPNGIYDVPLIVEDTSCVWLSQELRLSSETEPFLVLGHWLCFPVVQTLLEALPLEDASVAKITTTNGEAYELEWTSEALRVNSQRNFCSEWGASQLSAQVLQLSDWDKYFHGVSLQQKAIVSQYCRARDRRHAHKRLVENLHTQLVQLNSLGTWTAPFPKDVPYLFPETTEREVAYALLSLHAGADRYHTTEAPMAEYYATSFAFSEIRDKILTNRRLNSRVRYSSETRRQLALSLLNALKTLSSKGLVIEQNLDRQFRKEWGTHWALRVYYDPSLFDSILSNGISRDWGPREDDARPLDQELPSLEN